ncbi:MAG TPA: prepilin-type N-terminal cleavage/methylation domain-containing protein [Candidatus Saccharimonadales bacterium]|nr:prepilin-type N-terminal cleavage/methylation domain-containing protein [Candidatus Saccharimonadales bacterium]
MRPNNSFVRGADNKKSGFTLIEILVAMAVFMLAISIALFATIGSNSLIDKANTRSALVESSRSVTDALGRLTTDTPYTGVTLLKADGTSAGSSAGVALLVRVYNQALGQNLCELIGRAKQTTDATGENTYTLANDSTGTFIAMWVYSLNNAGYCDSNPAPYLLFQNRLSDPVVEVTNFQLAMNTLLANQVGMIRYDLNLQTVASSTGTTAEGKNASIEVASGLPVGLN